MIKILMAFAFLCSVYPVYAGMGTDINFKGSLFEPACEFNSGKVIDINFDKVGVKKIDGIRYARTVTVNLTCRSSLGKKLMLQIQGDSVNGSVNVLKTNVSNLGISFRDNKGEPLILNRFFDSHSETAFTFIVVPVKMDAGISLPTGEFSAVATLVSSYF